MYPGYLIPRDRSFPPSCPWLLKAMGRSGKDQGYWLFEVKGRVKIISSLKITESEA